MCAGAPHSLQGAQTSTERQQVDTMNLGLAPQTRFMLRQPFVAPFALRRFFAEGTTPDAAIGELRRELLTREARFAALLDATVFASSSNPYRRLFDHAGCEQGDVEALLARDGVDETLGTLAEGGVYLMPGEVKGVEDVVRGSLRFRLDSSELLAERYPRMASKPAFLSQTSGSTGAPVRTPTSLAWQERETLAFAAFLKAHDLFDHRLAAYEPMLAGVAAGIQSVNMMARLGVPLTRWFAREVPVSGVLEAAYFRLTAHQIAWAGERYGPGYARPERVRRDEIGRIARWVESQRAAGARTCIRTVASNAARLARWALEHGVSLEGCTFIASGEPVTAAKRRVIQEAGARVAVLWGFEPGCVHVGLGCARPEHGDEMHVLSHSLAVVPHPEPQVEGVDGPIRPLLFTTLYLCAARLRINVSNGDFATLTRRECGCELEAAGLDLHVHDVGSYEKLTSEGLAYSRDQLFDVLETRLPERFGGGPGDYQLVEEEIEGGKTYLTLCVAPEVGQVDDAALLDLLAAELALGSRSNRFASGLWKTEGTLRVRREAPHASSRGKILPLRLTRHGRQPRGD